MTGFHSRIIAQGPVRGNVKIQKVFVEVQASEDRAELPAGVSAEYFGITVPCGRVNWPNRATGKLWPAQADLGVFALRISTQGPPNMGTVPPGPGAWAGGAVGWPYLCLEPPETDNGRWSCVGLKLEQLAWEAPGVGKGGSVMAADGMLC